MKLGGPSSGGATISSVATSPSQITGNQNDYNPGAKSLFQRWATDATRSVTGLTFSAAQVDGQVHLITNPGSSDVVIANQSASSTAANRWLTDTGSDITLSPNQMALAIYDDTTDRWRVAKLGGAGGSGTPGGSNTQIQFNSSGSFGGSANLTWDNAVPRLTVNAGFVPKRVASATDYTATAADNRIAITNTSAPRTVTLPAGSTMAAGQPLTIIDESTSDPAAGAALNFITIVRAGSDTFVGGGTSLIISCGGCSAGVYWTGSAWKQF
jgi:hypothetical protein